jgi:hypothetical protein
MLTTADYHAALEYIRELYEKPTPLRYAQTVRIEESNSDTMFGRG